VAWDYPGRVHYHRIHFPRHVHLELRLKEPFCYYESWWDDQKIDGMQGSGLRLEKMVLHGKQGGIEMAAQRRAEEEVVGTGPARWENHLA
jgi:hypothetical protein